MHFVPYMSSRTGWQRVPLNLVPGDPLSKKKNRTALVSSRDIFSSPEGMLSWSIMFYYEYPLQFNTLRVGWRLGRGCF